ncbi:MAG: hypothetical protein CMM87_03875 [Rickettsiales bacterium]|nr:hypothetical protein [Rickettsiales bacterium]|tara:strand:+ start:12653 stop:13003 length:351 start_codon:yes stop_codon:yes gene_type:complete
MSSFIEKARTKTLEILGFCKHVGSDSVGNTYYQSTTQKNDLARWVVYNKGNDPTTLPPVWAAWLQSKTLPVPQKKQCKDWQKQRLPNLSGTDKAHKPEQSNDSYSYQAWTPQKNKV